MLHSRLINALVGMFSFSTQPAMCSLKHVDMDHKGSLVNNSAQNYRRESRNISS